MNAIISVFQIVKRESPILYWIVMMLGACALGCIVGLFIDDRSLMGINVWIKPLKFSLSGAIYTFTVGYLMTLYPFSRIKKNILNNLVSWTMLIEIIIILFQASRGVQSHYNMTTPLNGMLFAAMGILIAINVLIMVLFVIETIRLKMNTPRSIQMAILLGWIIVVVGSWVGGQMIGQMSHNVGVADGGEGLPLLNWSTIAGDLRIAHFFGLHAIQVIPLFAFLLYTKWSASTKIQIFMVLIFGLLYGGWIGHTFYQAKQGIPLIQM